MVGERLAEIRKDHNDTQAVLAKKLNVSVTTVRSWEQEKSSPSHDALVAICRLYRISADYLLGLSEVDPAYDPRGNQQRLPMMSGPHFGSMKNSCCGNDGRKQNNKKTAAV